MEESDEAPIIKSEPGVTVADEAAPRSMTNQKAQNGMQSLQQAADIASASHSQSHQMAILQQQLGLGVQSQQQSDLHTNLVVQQHGGSSTSSEALSQNQVSASGLYTNAAGNLQQASGDYVIPGTGLLQTGSGFVPVPIVPHPESTGDESDIANDTRHAHDELREQDRFLPIANVARIMKKAIPENGKVDGLSICFYTEYLKYLPDIQCLIIMLKILYCGVVSQVVK